MTRPDAGRPGAPLLSRQALETLRRAILDGAIRPGDRLVEERLSAELGISRVPIREAIKQLVTEGLAEPARGGRGVQVAALTAEFAEDLIEVRAVLEALTARLAARHRDAAAAAAIRDLIAHGEALAADGPAEELARLNGAFHDLVVLAGANRVLQDMMRPLRERTEMLFRRNAPVRARPDWQDHVAILRAILDGDEELAALLATRHVRRAASGRAIDAGPVPGGGLRATRGKGDG
jgi:DNA-binding GntR family transcriptional regulator